MAGSTNYQAAPGSLGQCSLGLGRSQRHADLVVQPEDVRILPNRIINHARSGFRSPAAPITSVALTTALPTYPRGALSKLLDVQR